MSSQKQWKRARANYADKLAQANRRIVWLESKPPFWNLVALNRWHKEEPVAR